MRLKAATSQFRVDLFVQETRKELEMRLDVQDAVSRSNLTISKGRSGVETCCCGRNVPASGFGTSEATHPPLPRLETLTNRKRLRKSDKRLDLRKSEDKMEPRPWQFRPER